MLKPNSAAFGRDPSAVLKSTSCSSAPAMFVRPPRNLASLDCRPPSMVLYRIKRMETHEVERVIVNSSV
jgi:hypothetical protein